MNILIVFGALFVLGVACGALAVRLAAHHEVRVREIALERARTRGGER